MNTNNNTTNEDTKGVSPVIYNAINSESIDMNALDLKNSDKLTEYEQENQNETMRLGGVKVDMTKDAIDNIQKEEELLNNNGKFGNRTAFELSSEEIEMLQFHPYMEAIPCMNKDERNSLLEDIQANGFTDYITITREMVIVDGRERVNIIKNHEISHTPLFYYHDGDEENILDFIISKNIQRRHLSKGQKAVISLKFYDILKEKNLSLMSHRMIDMKDYIGKEVVVDAVDSRTETAKYFGISSSYIGKAQKVKSADSKLLQQVFEGQISLEKAYNQINNDDGTSDSKQIDLFQLTLNEFENEHGGKRIIVEETLSLLTKLGINSQTAQKAICEIITKEQTQKEKWAKQSDDAKFEIYLKDFTESMRRYLLSDEKEFRKFQKKVNAVKTNKAFVKLDEKIERLKEVCTNEEKEFFKTSIATVNIRMPEVPDSKKFEAIILTFVELVSGEFNDN